MKYDNDLLNEREKTHGDFDETVTISQELKRTMRWAMNGKGSRYTDRMRESLELIATKLARLFSGSPFDPEHWRDIAGYATLIAEHLEQEQAAKEPHVGKVMKTWKVSVDEVMDKRPL